MYCYCNIVIKWTIAQSRYLLVQCTNTSVPFHFPPHTRDPPTDMGLFSPPHRSSRIPGIPLAPPNLSGIPFCSPGMDQYNQYPRSRYSHNEYGNYMHAPLHVPSHSFGATPHAMPPNLPPQMWLEYARIQADRDVQIKKNRSQHGSAKSSEPTS